MRLRLTLVILFALRPALAETFSAKVVGVTDGDTLTVLRGTTKTRVILHGIDCPEPTQAYGDKAKKLTGELASGKEVRIEVVDTDRYKRLVGNVILPNGKLLNQELVCAGLAWWSDKYAPDDKTLRDLQSGATKAKRGLWAHEKPTPPWQYRRTHPAKPSTEKKTL